VARLNLPRRKRKPSPQHPVYYGHRLPERIVHITIVGACETCHEEREYDMPCPHCGEVE
jgi:hypothetical protein